MTNKVYKSAMGKPVDMGSLLLQNENVRAVGNMNVNARGDLLDSGNKIIDKKNRQIQRQQKKTVALAKNNPVATSNISARKAREQQNQMQEILAQEAIQDEFDEPAVVEEVVEETIETQPLGDQALLTGGLASAIARARSVNQELEKTPRQLRQEQGIKKI